MVFYPRFSFNSFTEYFLSQQASSILLIFSTLSNSIESVSVLFYKSVFRNDFLKSAKDQCLNIGCDIIPHEQHKSSPRVDVSVKFSVAGVTGSVEFQRHLHGLDLNGRHGAVPIIVKTVVIHAECILLTY